MTTTTTTTTSTSSLDSANAGYERDSHEIVIVKLAEQWKERLNTLETLENVIFVDNGKTQFSAFAQETSTEHTELETIANYFQYRQDILDTHVFTLLLLHTNRLRSSSMHEENHMLIMNSFQSVCKYGTEHLEQAFRLFDFCREKTLQYMAHPLLLKRASVIVRSAALWLVNFGVVCAKLIWNGELGIPRKEYLALVPQNVSFFEALQLFPMERTRQIFALANTKTLNHYEFEKEQLLFDCASVTTMKAMVRYRTMPEFLQLIHQIRQQVQRILLLGAVQNNEVVTSTTFNTTTFTKAWVDQHLVAYFIPTFLSIHQLEMMDDLTDAIDELFALVLHCAGHPTSDPMVSSSDTKDHERSYAVAETESTMTSWDVAYVMFVYTVAHDALFSSKDLTTYDICVNALGPLDICVIALGVRFCYAEGLRWSEFFNNADMEQLLMYDRNKERNETVDAFYKYIECLDSLVCVHLFRGVIQHLAERARTIIHDPQHLTTNSDDDKVAHGLSVSAYPTCRRDQSTLDEQEFRSYSSPSFVVLKYDVVVASTSMSMLATLITENDNFSRMLRAYSECDYVKYDAHQHHAWSLSMIRRMCHWLESHTRVYTTNKNDDQSDEMVECQYSKNAISWINNEIVLMERKQYEIMDGVLKPWVLQHRNQLFDENNTTFNNINVFLALLCIHESERLFMENQFHNGFVIACIAQGLRPDLPLSYFLCGLCLWMTGNVKAQQTSLLYGFRLANRVSQYLTNASRTFVAAARQQQQEQQEQQLQSQPLYLNTSTSLFEVDKERYNGLLYSDIQVQISQNYQAVVNAMIKQYVRDEQDQKHIYHHIAHKPQQLPHIEKPWSNVNFLFLEKFKKNKRDDTYSFQNVKYTTYEFYDLLFAEDGRDQYWPDAMDPEKEQTRLYALYRKRTSVLQDLSDECHRHRAPNPPLQPSSSSSSSSSFSSMEQIEKEEEDAKAYEYEQPEVQEKFKFLVQKTISTLYGVIHLLRHCGPFCLVYSNRKFKFQRNMFVDICVNHVTDWIANFVIGFMWIFRPYLAEHTKEQQRYTNMILPLKLLMTDVFYIVFKSNLTDLEVYLPDNQAQDSMLSYQEQFIHMFVFVCGILCGMYETNAKNETYEDYVDMFLEWCNVTTFVELEENAFFLAWLRTGDNFGAYICPAIMAIVRGMNSKKAMALKNNEKVRDRYADSQFEKIVGLYVTLTKFIGLKPNTDYNKYWSARREHSDIGGLAGYLMVLFVDIPHIEKARRLCMADVGLFNFITIHFEQKCLGPKNIVDDDVRASLESQVLNTFVCRRRYNDNNNNDSNDMFALVGKSTTPIMNEYDWGLDMSIPTMHRHVYVGDTQKAFVLILNDFYDRCSTVFANCNKTVEVLLNGALSQVNIRQGPVWALCVILHVTNWAKRVLDQKTRVDYRYQWSATNVEVAKNAYERFKKLANSCFLETTAILKNMKLYEPLLMRYNNQDVKICLALQALANAQVAFEVKQFETARLCAWVAIGLEPYLPLTYFMYARTMWELGILGKSENAFLMALYLSKNLKNTLVRRLNVEQLNQVAVTTPFEFVVRERLRQKRQMENDYIKEYNRRLEEQAEQSEQSEQSEQVEQRRLVKKTKSSQQQSLLLLQQQQNNPTYVAPQDSFEYNLRFSFVEMKRRRFSSLDEYEVLIPPDAKFSIFDTFHR